MDKKQENSDLLYNNSNFIKLSITDDEFNELRTDTKYKHLQKFFNKIIEFRRVKPKTVGTKKRNFFMDNAPCKLFNE